MGCTQSSQAIKNETIIEKKKVTSFDLVKKREGHPSSFKMDGYEVGLRIRDNVNGVFSMYVGTSKGTQQRVTIKEFHLKSSTSSAPLIQREVSILHNLSGHETVPRLYELFLTDSSMFMVTQYVDMFRLKNFVDMKSEKVAFTMPEIRKIVKKLLNAIEHCHNRFVVLRCLTPEQILVKKISDSTNASTSVPFQKEKDGSTSGSSSGSGSGSSHGKEKVAEYEVMITDLALAVAWDDGEQSAEPLQSHPLFDWSLLPYCAPEVITRMPVSPATDLWSLGVLVYLLVGGNLPFVVPDMSMDRMQLCEKIAHADYSFGAQAVWAEMRLDIRSVVTGLLLSDAAQRSTVSELKSNHWLLRG